MILLPELSDQLASAAERRVHHGASRRHLAPRIAGLLALAVVGAGGVAAASGVWSPQVGDDRRGHPTVSPSSPPAEQLERFGILRRAPTVQDRGAQSRYALRFQGPDLRGVRTDFVRVLGRQANGRGVVLIPAREAQGKHDALCVFAQDVDGGGEFCSTTTEALRGYAVGGLGPPPAADAAGGVETDAHGSHLRRSQIATPDAGSFFGLVPDGVARVQVGDAPSVPVHDNFFVVSLTTTTPMANGPADAIRWLDAEGRVVPR